MPRELTDEEGIRWVCVEAYAGLKDGGDEGGGNDAAQVAGDDGRVHVVCTPSGGAQTVRLQLGKGWEAGRSDEELLREIKSRQAGGS